VIDPTRIDDLSTTIVDVYRRAELYLVEVIRRALIRTGESPDWARAQLLAIRQERGNIQGLATVLQKRLPMWHTAVSEAWTRGQLDAEAEMVRVPEDKTPIPSPVPISLNTEAVIALTTEAMNTMTPVHRGILRATDDIWRRINAEATGYVLTGSMTPYQAAKRSFTRMTREGLPFFTDKRGRKWGLDTYAEMAVRTATNQALRAGHEDTMRSYGVDLMVVSSHKNPAPQCAPYERKVLSLGKYDAGTHRIGDNIVQVKATMDDAVAHGFRHANCKHRVSAYIPGFTRTNDAPYDGDDSGYKATQKQRYLERQIRKSKMMEAAAIDETDVREARMRIRNYQKKLRDHVGEHDLPRRRHREQVRNVDNGAIGMKINLKDMWTEDSDNFDD